MYSLSIHFGTGPMPAQFLFKDKNNAELAYNEGLNETCVEIIDDFGQKAKFEIGQIYAVILEDMELGEEARIQRGLSQARGQTKANERARTDPLLRQAMNRQGPAVLTPGFGRN